MEADAGPQLKTEEEEEKNAFGLYQQPQPPVAALASVSAHRSSTTAYYRDSNILYCNLDGTQRLSPFATEFIKRQVSLLDTKYLARKFKFVILKLEGFGLLFAGTKIPSASGGS